MKIEEELKSRFRNEHHKLMVNIFLTSARLSDRFQEVLRASDITQPQYNVLRILRGQNRKAVSIGLIRERMIDRSSDVSRIIDRLLLKKLIERKENKLDRRQKDVLISQRGLDLLAQIDDCEKQMDKELKGLTVAEARQVNVFLDKLRKKIKTS